MTIADISRGLAATAIAIALATAAQAQPVKLKLDQETSVGGVDVACTGVGQTKDDPKWLAYPVRVEFAGAGGEYLADEVLRVVDRRDQMLLEVGCEGPWILLKLKPGGRYRLSAIIDADGHAGPEATVKPPRHGQARIVLTLPSKPRSPD